MNTLNPHRNPNGGGGGAVAIPLPKRDNWKERGAGPGVGVGGMAAEHTLASPVFKLLFRHSALFGEKSRCHVRPNQKHEQVTPGYRGKRHDTGARQEVDRVVNERGKRSPFTFITSSGDITEERQYNCSKPNG